MQESGYSYDPDKKLFVKREFDAQNGISSEWQRSDPDHAIIQRQTLIGTGQSRVVIDTRHLVKNTFKFKTLRYEVHEVNSDYDKEISLGNFIRDDQTVEPKLIIDFKNKAIKRLVARYEPSELRHLFISIPTEEYSANFYDNMSHLLDIAKERGSSIFLLVGKSAWGKDINDPNNPYAYLSLRSIPMHMFRSGKKLTEEEIDSSVKTIYGAISSELVPFSFDSYFTSQREVITLALITQTLAFIHREHLKAENLEPEEIRMYLTKGTANLLKHYFREVKRMGGTVPGSSPDNTEDGGNLLSIDKLKYENLEYYAVKDREGNVVKVIIRDTKENETTNAIELPLQIDPQLISQTISTPENTGWERVFDLISVRIGI